MQSLSVKKGSLKSIVQVPTSKSYANRALILSAIQKKKTVLTHVPSASDVTILLECLKKIGLEIHTKEDSVTILDSFPECETSGATLEVGEGGTTARFLAGMLLLGKEEYILHLGQRLKDRPWKEFIDQANSLGAAVNLSGDKLSIRGPVKFPALLKVDCSKTTQFATALQLIAPSTTKIQPVNLHSSLSYWRMNEKIVNDLKQDSYAIPADWSSASYPMAFAALHHKISFPNLYHDEFQADAKFLSILKSFATITESSQGIEVSPSKTEGDLHVDVSDSLDLVPTLGFFLSHIKGRHILSGIENLVHKESDRLTEIIKLLKTFDRHAEVKDGVLIVDGHHEIVHVAKQLVLPDDHRMVMVGTLFLLHHNGGTISPAEAVNKSYPEFFDLLSSHGEMNKSGK